MSPGEAAIARTKLVDYSKQFIGKPYLAGGIGPNSFDCSGLVFTVSRESIGIQLPRTTRAIYSFCIEVKDEEREAGDLVFFKTTSSGNVSHVGIYIGNKQFIHAASDGPNTGVIISSLKEGYWKSHYFCTRRYLPSSNSELLTEKKSVKKSNSEEKSSSQTRTIEASAQTQTKKSSSNKSILSSLIFDASLAVDWSFFTPEAFRLNCRGFNSMIHVRYAGEKIQPGIGSYIRFDAGTGTVQFPFVLSLTLNNFSRIFAGPVVSFGSASLPDDSDYKIKTSFFPGILGFSFNTPSVKLGKIELSLIQDLQYTVYNKKDGSALSAGKSLGTGIVFSTGLRVTLPYNNVL